MKLRKSEAVLIILTAVFIVAAGVQSFLPTRSMPTTLVQTDFTVSDSEKLISADGQEITEGLGIININTAEADKLCQLPGIGPELAKRIIDSRPFENPEDILDVPGIGEKTFGDIKELITCMEDSK